MYPAHGLALFPPFPRDERIFVAMSFDPRLERRWKDVIELGAQDAGLHAFRVDVPKVSSSIPTDILVGIAQSRLVLADVTALDGHRNGNVMYEVGIAHAVRQPEEVVLFRSDREPLLFDVSTIRVNRYEPEENSGEARQLVTDAILSAIREVDVSQALAVRRAAEALDGAALVELIEAMAHGPLIHPNTATMRDALVNTSRAIAFGRLLELGLLTADWSGDEPRQRDNVQYRVTEFGGAVVKFITSKLTDRGPSDTPRS